MSIAATYRAYFEEINRKNTVIRNMSAHIEDQQQTSKEVANEINELIEENTFPIEVESRLYRCVEKLLTNEA